MKNIAKAIVNVMKEVKGVEKNTTVGSGRFAYKGVNDKDVKEAYRVAMIENGLSILPIEVEENLNVNNWVDQNGKNKMSVFCSVNTKYLLLHTSGESQIIAGLGHGQDPMDKAAGKATTYAMKYALLYTFMTPVGAIDDTDKEHSEQKEAPTPDLKPITKGQEKELAKWAVKNKATIEQLKKYYTVTKEQEQILLDEMAKINAPKA